MTEIYKLLQKITAGRGDDFDIAVDMSYQRGCAYSARGGKVYIIGKDRNFVCRGIYEYLRKYCGFNYTWTAQSAVIPAVMPDAPETIVNSPYRHRLYMNMCTFGYSTVWWDWNRWEKEIEWMALRGINMPLAMCGQEAIWVKVWNEFGVGREKLDTFFTGPAYLPWNRCGNLNGFDAPLPDSWIEHQRLLQKKIIDKMAAFDIEPIVPAFNGYVPASLAEIYPDEQIHESSQWAKFDSKYTSRLLSTKSPLFTKISERFIKIYESEYGRQKYYLADIFHENNPADMKHDVRNELAEYALTIFNGIKAGNPEGVWVLQGWSFYFDDAFWTKENVKALLSKVPADEAIVIDLCNERFSGWRKFDSYYGRKWIYSFVHNFGGNDLLNGDLKFFAEHTAQMLSSSAEPVGFGISPEGIENNEAVYELLTDLAWSSEKIDVEQWLRRYCANRYHSGSEDIQKAWKILLEGTYCCNNTNIKHGFQHRPSPRVVSYLSNAEQLRQVLGIFLNHIDKLRENRHFIYDTIEILSQYCGIVCDKGLQLAYNAFSGRDTEKGRQIADKVFMLLYQIDVLMCIVPGRSFCQWNKSAEAMGQTSEEKFYFRKNGRRLLSNWGGPILADYAARMWSGLIYNYYAARWQAFFLSVINNQQFDVRRWEDNWIERGREYDKIVFDVVVKIRKAVSDLTAFDDRLKEENALCHSLKAGRWVSRDYSRATVDVSHILTQSGEYLLRIESDPGMSMPPVKCVRLYANDRPLSSCRPAGDNCYEIQCPDRKPGLSYSVAVEFGDCKNRETFGDFWMSCIELKEFNYNTAAEKSECKL